jgi:hypothetical protein
MPHRDRLAHAERIAHGQHDIAHSRGFGIAEHDRGQALELQAKDRQVGLGVAAHDLRLGATAVGEQHFDVVRRFDDVVVGQHQTVGRYDDAGAQARGLLALRELFAEESAEQRGR